MTTPPPLSPAPPPLLPSSSRCVVSAASSTLDRHCDDQSRRRCTSSGSCLTSRREGHPSCGGQGRAWAHQKEALCAESGLDVRHERRVYRRRCPRTRAGGSSTLSDTPVLYREGRGGARPVSALGTVGAVIAVLGATGLTTVRATSAGSSHTCTLVTDNTIKCWGSNAFGQLSNNDTTVRGTAEADMSNLPVVKLGSDFSPAAISSGENYNCALNTNGGLKCWGLNDYGQLGLGDTEQRGGFSIVSEMGDDLRYVDLGLPEGEVAKFVGCSDKHTCAVTTAGGIKCWGYNDEGQLGYENTTNIGTGANQMGEFLPYVDIGVLDNETATAVALGFKHTCALVSNGGVKCWGNNNGGQLGYEDTVGRGSTAGTMGTDLEYVFLGREQYALAIAAGAFHSCALLNTGNVKCWGFGADGQLGQGSNASIGTAADSMGDNLPPINLGEGRTALAVSAGAVHTCAVLDDNTVKCWGNNDRGTLGVGDTTFRGREPGQMGDNLPNVNLTFGRGEGLVANVFAGTFHTCVSGTSGGIACFGINQYGQLGVGDNLTYGDEPGEVNLLESVFVGSLPVQTVDPFAGEFDPVTISPTAAPVPTPAPIPQTLAPSLTQMPIDLDAEVGSTSAPVGRGLPSPAQNTGDSSDEESVSTGATAGIAVAAVVAALGMCIAVGCCYVKRKKHRDLDKPTARAGAGGAAVGDDTGRNFSRADSGASSELHVEANGDGPSEALAHKPLVKPNTMQSTTPLANAVPNGAPPPAAAVTAGGIPADVGIPPAAPRAFGPANLADAGVVLPSGRGAVAGAGVGDNSSSSTSVSFAGGSVADSSDSASEFSAASSASTAWTADGFQTPARTDIPRGSGGIRYGGGGGGRHSSNASASLSDAPPPSESGDSVHGAIGMRTPGSHLGGLAEGPRVPDTPSPRSNLSMSGSGTPHPPEMRLAQFARANAGAGNDSDLYGVPEVEINRSASNLFESNSQGNNGWPGAAAHAREPSTSSSMHAVTSSGRLSADASAARAGGAGLAGGGGGVGQGAEGGEREGEEGALTPDGKVPLHPIKTPTHTRQPRPRPGINGAGPDVGGLTRKRSNRSSNRSSKTLGGTSAGSGSPVEMDSGGSGRSGFDTAELAAAGWASGRGGAFSAGGNGVDEVTRSFAEEAELEALQIDKNDLKLVFGRPFARGKTSEVYQVTHAGKNRAAKIIDLFLLGVVGDEVTRLYSCFAQELRAMKEIRHDCVSAVYGAVATPSELTIVTDLVKRGPLRGVLNDKAKRDSLTADVRRKIMKDVALGMAYLEEHGVHHRNLHSHNVLITKEWGAKVADYGFASTMEVLLCADGSGKPTNAYNSNSSSLAKHKCMAWRSATLRWTAPELLRPTADGSDPFTTASDVYSMGVILWEILCGGAKLPWDGVPDEKLKSMILEGSTPPVAMEIPIAYSKLMYLCWRKNPISRPTFKHVGEVLSAEPPPANISSTSTTNASASTS